MTKAEERALEAYLVTMVRRRYDGIARSDDPYDSNLHDRYCFQRGYELAEKDLRLTWKDMKRISRILDIMVEDDFKGEIPEEWGEEEYYEEVLRRFKVIKKARK